MNKVMMHPNPLRDIDLEITCKIAEFLRQHGVEVTIPSDILSESNALLNALSFEDAIKNADMIISLGGDGSILHTARQAAEHAIPILGVNIGRMGYMAELDLDELGAFEDILNGNYSVEDRMMLKLSVIRNGKCIYENFGLNDVVISRASKLKIIDFDIYADEFFISHYCGDGVVIATPTGSTAYSMSAGGPIVDPITKNLIITPVCSHSLTAKPIILDPNRTVCVKPKSDIENAIGVSIDGCAPISVICGDEVLIKKSEHNTKLVRVKNKNFYDILCTKLLERRYDVN